MVRRFNCQSVKYGIFQQSTARNNKIKIYKDFFMIVVISVSKFCG